MHFYPHHFKAMGTPCTFQCFATSEQQITQAYTQVLADIARLEARYSRYRADSFLSEINQVAARGGCIKVDSETEQLLRYADTCYQQSDGLFDITSGILRQAWRFELAQLPPQKLIEDLVAKIGWHRIQWQPPFLHFPIPGMELDFGGIVKEYAADRAASLCWQAGIRHGLINLGGDIKIIGPQVDDSPWRIGIRDPRRPQGELQLLSLSAGALASSGDYERCFIYNGKRYGHLLNPKTGWPVQHLTAVSVVADLCVLAGSAATIALLKEQAGPNWLTDLGLAHLWVDSYGQCGGSLWPPDPA